MGNEVDTEALFSKADRMYDSSRPGFVHAERRPGSREGWIELAFPCGLVCDTNSSPLETELTYYEVFINHEYLRSGISLSDGDTIVDVGANVGMFTMYALRNLNDIEIHAIEPVPESFEVLQQNVDRYRHGGVHLHNTALGADPDGETQIVLYPNMTGNSTLHEETKVLQREVLSELFTEEELAFIFTRKQIPVSTTTLSSLIRNHGIQTISLLKIDAEGSEIDILKGIDTAHWDLIRQLAIEVHDAQNTLPVIHDILRVAGMRGVTEEDTRDPFGTVVVTASRG